MSNFGNYDLRTALIFCYCHLKKTVAESHRILVEAYGEHALGKSHFEWFKKFKSGDFDVRNEELGKPPKKFEDSELQVVG